MIDRPIDQNPEVHEQWLTELREAVTEAVESRKLVKIKYMDMKLNVSERTVEPTEMRDKGFFAWCRNRDAIRQFNWFQVTGYEVTTELFEARDFGNKKDTTQPGTDIS